MRPEPDTTICDPACGTGGFLLAAHDYIVRSNPSMNQGQRERLQNRTLYGWDYVAKAVRLGVMNLYLHGIGGDETNIVVDDSLRTHPGVNFDMVLTNPPFGKKSSLTFVGSDGEADRESLVVERPDFWATSSNKQLNFLQHVRSLLKIHGRAAIVVPDNVLFEGGAGENRAPPPARRVRRPHTAPAPDRHFLRPGGQGQRAVLRSQARQRESLDSRPVDLRPAHQPALHPEGQPAHSRRPGRFRGLLQPGKPPPTPGDRAVPSLQLRRPDEAGQGESRHLLAPRREYGGHRQPPAARHHRR